MDTAACLASQFITHPVSSAVSSCVSCCQLLSVAVRYHNKYCHEDIRDPATKTTKCHQRHQDTGCCGTRYSAIKSLGHNGRRQPGAEACGGQGSETGFPMHLGHEEGSGGGQCQDLQRQAEPQQGSQDITEATGQGQADSDQAGQDHEVGRSFTAIEGHPDQDRQGHIAHGPLRQVAEEQVRQAGQIQKEINKQHQRLSPVIWYDLVLHGLTYTGTNIKCRHEHRYKNNDNG